MDDGWKEEQSLVLVPGSSLFSPTRALLSPALSGIDCRD